MLVVISFCLTVVLGTQYHSRLNMRFPPKSGVTSHFGYSLPSGYASTSFHFRPLSIDAINKYALSNVAKKNKKAFIKPLLKFTTNPYKYSDASRKYPKYYNHRPYVTPTYATPSYGKKYTYRISPKVPKSPNRPIVPKRKISVPSTRFNTIRQYPQPPVLPNRSIPQKQSISNPTTRSPPKINLNKISNIRPKNAVISNPTTRSPLKIDSSKVVDKTPKNPVQTCVNCIPDSGEDKEMEDKTVASVTDNLVDDSKMLEAAEEGLSLLSELVENLKQEAQTSADSDPEEVTAVKGVFLDVIDEIIKQIDTNFKKNASNSSDIDSLLSSSKMIRNDISEALTQTRLVAILEPYTLAISNLFRQGMQAKSKL